jgi:hypothetical protein
MPKVTSQPSAASAPATPTASRNAVSLSIRWSAGMTSMVASDLRAAGAAPQRDRRGGVPRHRLQDDAGAAHSDFLQLLADHEAVVLAAHGHRMLHARRSVRAQHGLLVQRTIADQRQELLGLILAGKGPKAGAAATAENDW